MLHNYASGGEKFDCVGCVISGSLKLIFFIKASQNLHEVQAFNTRC